jgi:hypothetical protein
MKTPKLCSSISVEFFQRMMSRNLRSAKPSPSCDMNLLKLFLALATTAGLVVAQEVQPKSADGLRDDAIVFDATQASDMRAMLAKIRERDGVEAHVATHTFLSGSNVKEHTHLLMRAWLGETPGFVLAYNRGEGQPAVSLSPAFWRRYPTDEIVQLIQSTGKTLSADVAAPEVRLKKALEHISAALEQMEINRQARDKTLKPGDWKLAAGLGAAFLFLALLTGLIYRRVKAQTLARKQKFYFPDFEVGLRLGAPHGGGTLVEVSTRP